jgi:hypothetical protein
MKREARSGTLDEVDFVPLYILWGIYIFYEKKREHLKNFASVRDNNGQDCEVSIPLIFFFYFRQN